MTKQPIYYKGYTFIPKYGQWYILQLKATQTTVTEAKKTIDALIARGKIAGPVT